MSNFIQHRSLCLASSSPQRHMLLKNFGLAGGLIFIAINGPKDWALDTKKKYVRL